MLTEIKFDFAGESCTSAMQVLSGLGTNLVHNLVRLKLTFSFCIRITDAGVNAFAEELPGTLAEFGVHYQVSDEVKLRLLHYSRLVGKLELDLCIAQSHQKGYQTNW